MADANDVKRRAAESESKRQPLFLTIAKWTSAAVGSSWAFAAAVLCTLIWAASGPLFHYSDTWQLVINTSTTIATFLIVFLIQHTQNREARVMQLKLDELIRAVRRARMRLISMEDLTDEELQELQREFQEMQARAGEEIDERLENSAGETTGATAE